MDRARARWLEEFADSRMGEIFIWRFFNQVAIKSAAWSEPTDPSVVENTLKNDIPQILDYLETQVPAEGFIFGNLSVADISIVLFFSKCWLRALPNGHRSLAANGSFWSSAY